MFPSRKLHKLARLSTLLAVIPLSIGAISPEKIEVASGFEVELVYEVPKDEQGSWVGLATDPRGRILATDQYGSLYRLTLPEAKRKGDGPKVERLEIKLPPVGPDSSETDLGAHGLLYAFDSLYVMVSEIDGKRGVWRLRDSNGDDQFDQADYLIKLDGRGEHGPHSLVLSPDGKSIYFCAGNFTNPPSSTSSTRGVRWGEDHLLPRMWDARGHAKEKYAPGGWIARCDPNGDNLEIVAHGFRNHFDIAFDANGELFTYDSDMEWDQGSPWYLPTRINHAVDGADFGWRSGAGRWPAYYADSLPATIDIGPGSPTGVVMGTGAKFPAKYQRALFAADWTYGTLYAIHHEPHGATFKGTKEEFVSGKPLPLTDLIINPKDGAMYFAVGGRRTESALYRVTYTGEAKTDRAQPLPITPEAKLRRSLENYHSASAGPEAVDAVWPHLSHSDRFVRWAARVSLEHQPTSNWVNRALAEQDPQAATEALIALARVGEKRYQNDLIKALQKIAFPKAPTDLQLAILRAWQLVFTRMGKPDTYTKSVIAQTLSKHFPHPDRYANRELLTLLVYLESPTAVEKGIPLLSIKEPKIQTAEELGGAALIARNDHYGKVVAEVGDTRPDRQQIALAYILRNATAGWTPGLREQFFTWFSTTYTWKGGASFSGFLRKIRQEALDNIAPAAELSLLENLSTPPAHTFVTGSIPPQGPGQNYTVEGALKLIPEKLENRNFERGKSMFESTACLMCHRFGNDGGGIGPDITGSGNRYSIRDLLENIIEPSKVVSDQYTFDAIKMTDGSTLVAKILEKKGPNTWVTANPMMPDERLRIRNSEIQSVATHSKSMMPSGLINGLNPEELQDLLAYLLSGGNPNDPMFAQ